MAPYYSFAIIQFSPGGSRAERLNVGLAVLKDENIDVRVGRKLEKIKAISSAVDLSVLRHSLENLKLTYEQTRNIGATVEQRIQLLSQMSPLSLSKLGKFVATDAAAYESRVESTMRALVDPEPATRSIREKRSGLFTQVKRAFRSQGVLAHKDEDISSHRIVPDVELDEGLIADLVLKNGHYHVVETVDVATDKNARKVVSDIAVAALVLERARMKFGNSNTRPTLVYNASSIVESIATPSLEAAEHGGAVLVNWASVDDRGRFVHLLASLAEPHKKQAPPRLRVVGGI